MKTKFLSTLLAISLALLAACGGPSALDSTSAGNQSFTESTFSYTPLEKNEEEMEPFNKDPVLPETVMVDENGVKITAKGLTYDEYYANLELLIENNSGKDLSFISGSVGYNCNSINGYMIREGYLNCDVADGKKANAVIQFNYDTLMLYGIHEIADIEIGFDIADDEYNHTYSGPRQLKTSAFDLHDYKTDPYQDAITSNAAMSTYGYDMSCFSKEALYDKNGVKLLSSGVMTNQDGDSILLLELENTNEYVVYISTSNIGINGLVVNSSIWSSSTINPGKRCILDVQLSSVFDTAYWGVYGIRDVGTVSLYLGQYGEDGDELAAETPVEIAVPGTSAQFDVSGNEIYNDNGLRIVAKTVLEEASEYSADFYVMLLAENNSGNLFTIRDVYDSLSVNGFMTDYSYYSQDVKGGESAVLTIKLRESSLEENRISSPSDIEEIEVSFEIAEGYTVIDEPTLTILFGEQS